ncbi:MAG TPA: hypothetical protein VE996_07485 [Terriglobales bacterium]|nr:hypothetical protein [Terriglobales bacterium]
MDAKEAGCCEVSKQNYRTYDLACGKSAVLLWYLPVLALIAGLNWAEGRPWLWIPAFAVMGVACLVNAARCGRLHCYVTGPVYLLAALYTAFAAYGILPLRPGLFLTIVLGIAVLALCAECPLGTYRRKA